MLQVFQKIQKRLSHGLSKNSPQQLEQRLANQYEQYLHTVNTTAGVFRDTIAAQVYDPLAPRSAVTFCCQSAIICLHYCDPDGCLIKSFCCASCCMYNEAGCNMLLERAYTTQTIECSLVLHEAAVAHPCVSFPSPSELFPALAAWLLQCRESPNALLWL